MPHNSSDLKSGRFGDIQVQDNDGNVFEAIEIKHDIQLTSELLIQLKEKIISSGMKTYYILSTNEKSITAESINKITEMIIEIKNKYGCQVILNGVASTLKYYLRLIKNPDHFVHNYVDLLDKDTDIPYNLKHKWNELNK
ncbi:MAG: hypothetical protein OXC92_05810 [Flavobacteriaceae bacterium]|nr:hypothetical protein [Flavobacteriaceae bacterium]